METCFRKGLPHCHFYEGVVSVTSQRSRQSHDGRVQHLASQEWLMQLGRLQALRRVAGAPACVPKAAVHPRPSHASTKFAAMPEIACGPSQAPADQLYEGPWSLEVLKHQEVHTEQTALPSKFHPHIVMRRIKAANSVWGLRSAVRHVGYAFSMECICAALSQLHYLCKQQQAQQVHSENNPKVDQFSSSSSSTTPAPAAASPSATSSPSGPHEDSTSSIASNLLPHAPPFQGTPPPQLSQLDLTTDTLDCLMHYLAQKGGFAALGPIHIASVASVLGHLLPSIPLHQPALSLPQPPPPGQEQGPPPKPCPAPPYRVSISARLSLAHDVALSAQPHLHALSAKQQSVLLQALARLGFQPSPAWCLAYYRASAVELQRMAQTQTGLVHGWQLLEGQQLRANSCLQEGQQQESMTRSMPRAAEHARIRDPVKVLGGSRVEVPGVEGLSGREAWCSGDHRVHLRKPIWVQAWAAPRPTHNRNLDPNSSSSGSSGDSGYTKRSRREQPQAALVPALSSMLWALAHLKCQPPPAWMHANLALCIPHLPFTQPHTLSTMAWALGSLGYQPPPGFTSALLNATGALLEREQHQRAALAVLVQSPQNGGHGSGQTPGAVHSHPTSSPVNPAGAPDEAGHPTRVGAHWNASQRVLLLWGLAQLEVRPPAAWMEGFLEGLLTVEGAGKQGMGGSEVSMLAHALAKQELKAAEQLPQQQQHHHHHHHHHQSQKMHTEPVPPPLANPRSVASHDPQSATQPLQASPFQLKPARSSLLQHTFQASSAQQGRPLNILQPKPRPSLPTMALMPLEAWDMAQQQQQQLADIIRMNSCPSLAQPNAPRQQPMTPVHASNPSSPAGSTEECEISQSSKPQLWHAGSSPGGRQLQERVLAQAMSEVFLQLPECSSRSLVTLLWSLAKLRLRPHPAFLAAVMDQFQQRWRAQDAGEHSSTCSSSTSIDLSSSSSSSSGGGGSSSGSSSSGCSGGCSSTSPGDENQGGGPSDDAGPCLELDGIRARNSRYVNATDTCMLAYSLACLKVKPSPVWQSRLMEAARVRLHEATPQQLANLVWGLVVMHAHPPMQWLLQLWRVLAGMRDSLGRAEQYQVAMAWLVLPRNHVQRAILAQHHPRLLEHILYSGTGSKADRSTTTVIAAPLSMAASGTSPAAAAPAAATAATSTPKRGSRGARPPTDAQDAGKSASTSCLPPTKWRVLARILKEGLARRSMQHAKRLRKAGKYGRADTGGSAKGRRQAKQPMRLRNRMRRVQRAMLARRRSVGMGGSSAKRPRNKRM
ncbi:hypothetical protein DUNSADRAFT_14677 [Dunaliella salina]|uniref:Uncharacterized protein n=1 Tax=Dunaliella salina TaxID=3046 RepID=A0ABQ7G6X2_DUNSA|nr:hypothetical protein DUNSADRAFT_14677 [Dunaliella salina]|eukprot:KAF5830364.1 hypothetical protein DUNSADRAFT_14677 [Dunaliella salina]